jgi:hypothetical protein
MGFLSDFLANMTQAAQQQQQVGGMRSPGGKKPECTPCAATAYVEGLRDSINGKPKRKKPRRR